MPPNTLITEPSLMRALIVLQTKAYIKPDYPFSLFNVVLSR